MTIELKKFIQERAALFWSTKDLSQISEALVLEQVLNYGDFEDVKLLLKILGMSQAAAIFSEQIKGKRDNYRPEIKNYFKLYFKEYAQRGTR